jgi:predicted transposase/invertase (TIGR01784 family)
MDYFATNDAVFKMLFADDNGNTDLLQALLAATFGVEKSEIKGLKIKNVELSPETVKDKYCRIDINAEINNALIDVEMQMSNDPHFAERLLFYWAKLFVSPLKRGNDYSKLKNCVSIAFLNHNLYKHRDYHSTFEVYDKMHKRAFTDKLQMHIYELHKVPKELILKNNNNELEWLKFLTAKSDEELEMLVTQTQNPDI